MTNTALLRSKIQALGLKYAAVADSIGITYYGLQKKMDNRTEFKASEIMKLSDFLRLTDAEKSAIFFAK